MFEVQLKDLALIIVPLVTVCISSFISLKVTNKQIALSEKQKRSELLGKKLEELYKDFHIFSDFWRQVVYHYDLLIEGHRTEKQFIDFFNSSVAIKEPERVMLHLVPLKIYFPDLYDIYVEYVADNLTVLKVLMTNKSYEQLKERAVEIKHKQNDFLEGCCHFSSEVAEYAKKTIEL